MNVKKLRKSELNSGGKSKDNSASPNPYTLKYPKKIPKSVDFYDEAGPLTSLQSSRLSLWLDTYSS